MKTPRTAAAFPAPRIDTDLFGGTKAVFPRGHKVAQSLLFNAATGTTDAWRDAFTVFAHERGEKLERIEGMGEGAIAKIGEWEYEAFRDANGQWDVRQVSREDYLRAVEACKLADPVRMIERAAEALDELRVRGAGLRLRNVARYLRDLASNIYMPKDGVS